jgi:hypothetical protein
MATLSGVTAFGQGLLDCIDPDVMRTLLFQGQGERPPVLTGVLPVELSAMRMPGQFSWIGTAERSLGPVDATTNASSITAAWRSSLGLEATRAATASALAGAGWEVRRPQSPGMGVFTSSSTPVQQQACREGRSVTFAARQMDGVTYLLLTIPRGDTANPACNQSADFFSGVRNTGFEPYLPRLEMPLDTATGVAASISNSGMTTGPSTPAITVRTEFSVRDSVANIGRHFAKQMTAQGWSSDATWSGAATAGSSWSRRGDDGAVLLARLSLTAYDDRRFGALLRISRQQ